MIRAVIDTNVLVSGLLSPSGNEALLLLAAHQGVVRPCLSEEIIEEYAGVLGRRKFGFPRQQVEAVVAMLRGRAELFRPKASVATSPDPADTKFLDCAAAAQAEFLVTGNKRDFPESPYGSTRVVSAGELLARIAHEL